MLSGVTPIVGLPEEEPSKSSALIARLEALVLEAPQDAELHRQLSIAYFRSGDASRAVKITQALVSANPFDVSSLAYLGSFLALAPCSTGVEPLLDFDNQVVIRRLFTNPRECTDVNDQLAAAVLTDPNLLPSRPGKATVDGLQTCEIWPRLVLRVPRFAAALRHAVDEALEDFGCDRVSSHPSADSHCHITAWGLVLERAGHQEPHVHPSGILSGVYYVRVPERLNSPRHAGDLRFRKQPPWVRAAAVSDELCRYVRPEPGGLVLFPSYFWHDTIQFDDCGTRISIAFDVLAPHVLPQEHE